MQIRQRRSVIQRRRCGNTFPARRSRQVGLDRVRSALAGIPDHVLRALNLAAREATGVAPALLAWLEQATGWELDRRAERDYPLREPLDAIDLEEIPTSILALAALAAKFKGAHKEVQAFLAATAECVPPPPALH